MKKYILESIQELRDKVTWPKWVQLQSSTILVAISSVIIALIISLMDLGFDTILGEFYTIFNRVELMTELKKNGMLLELYLAKKLR